MKQLLIYFYLLFFGSVLNAQIPDFPKSWEGIWKGDVVITAPNGGSYKVPVSLSVEPVDTSRWSWTLYYEAPKQSPRNYELVHDGSGWKIDEKNGVVLPQQFIGNRLACSFSVSGSLLICYYWMEGAELNMEIHTVAQQSNAPAEEHTETSSEVFVHTVGTFQKAKLNRK